MLVNIGRRAAPRTDLVGLLLECHGRIRSFLELAVALGAAVGFTPAQIRDAAQRIARYFEEALPLHVADEELSLLPRLRGRRPELDLALERMHREHAEHGPLLKELLAICSALQVNPAELASHQPRLRVVASALQRELLTHLEHEEALVVPAIADVLDDAERQAVLSELRQRRGDGRTSPTVSGQGGLLDSVKP